MEKVKCTDKLTNEEVLSKDNESRELMEHVKKIQMNRPYFASRKFAVNCLRRTDRRKMTKRKNEEENAE